MKEPSESTALLNNAVVEIKNLRRRNEIQSARLQMFDDMMMLFRAESPRYGSAHSPDVIYSIESYLASIKDTESAKTEG